ncbi:MAG TPA: hypothetical protein PKW07_05530 [Syntrophorhabdaceae bacterium]|nr:hypothetical protein [Syntrophorhabdaceae bacterium]
MIAAYYALGAKPKYKISYVEKFYDEKFLYSWLDSINWNSAFGYNDDIDNKIMNILVTLQYNRDFFGDMQAGKAVSNLFKYLDSKVNPDTGMCGKYNIHNPDELSRCVQFAYHILMPYFYDGREVLFKDKIINLTLKTQNRLGGYGVKLNSSACEDIDSVDLLIHLADGSNEKVIESLKKAFVWILSNQNEDGGFVFRRNEALWYGHEIMTAKVNESNMFATWFRTLSLVKISKYLNINNEFKYTKVPGY